MGSLEKSIGQPDYSDVSASHIEGKFQGQVRNMI